MKRERRELMKVADEHLKMNNFTSLVNIPNGFNGVQIKSQQMQKSSNQYMSLKSMPFTKM